MPAETTQISGFISGATSSELDRYVAESYYERWGFEALPVEAGELEARPIPKPMVLELGAIPKTDDALPGA